MHAAECSLFCFAQFSFISPVKSNF